MRTSMYISACFGILFLVLRFIGLFIEISHRNLYLFLGIGILLLVTIPLYLLERKRYDKMKRSVINKYKGKVHTDEKENAEKKTPINYPSFRNQKRGLTWGGGNIHAANAKRGSKRGFLKH